MRQFEFSENVEDIYIYGKIARLAAKGLLN